MLSIDADGSRITRLNAHVDDRTGVTVREYAAESRVVVHLGPSLDPTVSVFIGAPELARLIDRLNAAYTRVACRPYEDEPKRAASAA